MIFPYRLSLSAFLTVAFVFLSLTGAGAKAHEKVLYQFSGVDGDVGPIGPLVMDASGNIYGCTGTYPDGAVYELIPDGSGHWRKETLYTFRGANPSSGLTLDASGNLYGTEMDDSGVVGAVYELSPAPGGSWTETALHTFTKGTGDGWLLSTGVIFDPAGNLYGTTVGGGIADKGIVFQLSPAEGGGWTENILYDFLGGDDGSFPETTLAFDNAGNLYGTNSVGGGRADDGVVYELSPGPGGVWTESTILSFGEGIGRHLGSQPASALIVDDQGNLFGSTWFDGTVFELSPLAGGGWTSTVLTSFHSPDNGYVGSRGNLARDGAGNLYGTAGPDMGNVFELSPDSGGGGWTRTKIFKVKSPNQQHLNYWGLILDSSGNLYGTTPTGGTKRYGGVIEFVR